MSKDQEPGVAAAPAVASHLVEADPYLVAFSLTNPRKRRGLDIDSLNALAASIKAQGLAQPILVRPLPGARAEDTFFSSREEGHPLPSYELVCGERRLRSSRIAELSTIPMLVRDLSDEAALELQLVENIEREDLDPIEEAEGFELLRSQLGYTIEQITQRIAKGKGDSYVRKSLKLLDLTPDAREAMYEGHLGRSTALLVAHYPAEQQEEVVAYIKSLADNGAPAAFRKVRPMVYTRFNLDLTKAVWLLTDADLVPAAGACSSCPKRSGAHADLFGEGEFGPDSCTDADCFASKRLAHVERAKADAKKAGFKVVDDEEAKAAFFSPYSTAMRGFSRLTDIAYTARGEDGVEREVTFEDALRSMGKKAPKPRVIINPHTGEASKVITSELATKLIPPDGEDEEGGTVVEPDDDRPPEEQAIGDYQVCRAVTLRMFDAVRSRDRTDGDMLLIAKALFAILDDENLPLLEGYLSWTDIAELDYGEAVTVIHAKLDAMPPAELASVITMAAVEIVMRSVGYSNVFTDAQQVALASVYGVDVLAVRDKVAEDLARQDAGEDEA